MHHPTHPLINFKYFAMKQKSFSGLTMAKNDNASWSAGIIFGIGVLVYIFADLVQKFLLEYNIIVNLVTVQALGAIIALLFLAVAIKK